VQSGDQRRAGAIVHLGNMGTGNREQGTAISHKNINQTSTVSGILLHLHNRFDVDVGQCSCYVWCFEDSESITVLRLVVKSGEYKYSIFKYIQFDTFFQLADKLGHGGQMIKEDKR
jgi:hypothetical protein